MNRIILSAIAVIVGAFVFWLMLGDFALNVLWFLWLLGVLWLMFAGVYGLFRAVKHKGWFGGDA